jgi:hypothetical protein
MNVHRWPVVPDESYYNELSVLVPAGVEPKQAGATVVDL